MKTDAYISDDRCYRYWLLGKYILYESNRQGGQLPPWEERPYGVVSLLDMLEFSARDYVSITQRLALALTIVGEKKYDDKDINDALGKLLEETNRLGLLVTRDRIAEMFLEVVKANPKTSRMSDDKEKVHIYGEMANPRWAYHLETILSTLKSELGSVLLRIVPRERAKYCDPKWLTDSVLFNKYPDTVDEFQRAGRCFAYGENTACIFHLMRVTEFYLIKVADSLGMQFNPINWGAIGQHVTREMEKKYQNKTPDWRQSEPFYAEILTDIQAISRGHRNSALHELEKKYEEREAANMLTVIEGFAIHVANKL